MAVGYEINPGGTTADNLYQADFGSALQRGLYRFAQNILNQHDQDLKRRQLEAAIANQNAQLALQQQQFGLSQKQFEATNQRENERLGLAREELGIAKQNAAGRRQQETLARLEGLQNLRNAMQQMTNAREVRVLKDRYNRATDPNEKERIASELAIKDTGFANYLHQQQIEKHQTMADKVRMLKEIGDQLRALQAVGQTDPALEAAYTKFAQEVYGVQPPTQVDDNSIEGLQRMLSLPDGTSFITPSGVRNTMDPKVRAFIQQGIAKMQAAQVPAQAQRTMVQQALAETLGLDQVPPTTSPFQLEMAAPVTLPAGSDELQKAYLQRFKALLQKKRQQDATPSYQLAPMLAY